MRRVTLALALALALVAPASATHGTWLAGSGEREPSTRFDSPVFMFQRPNQIESERVYFNLRLVSALSPYSTTTTTTNVDGGNVYPPAGAYVVATLGFWRDCNRDGYVGLKTAPASFGALGQYSFEAAAAAGKPVDTRICRAGSPYWPYLDSGGPNKLVDELRAIGPCPPSDPEQCRGYTSLSANRRTNDVVGNASRVWGDWERPGKWHVPWSPLLPMPYGTFQDSNGALELVDAATVGSLSAMLGDQWTKKPNVGACDEPHPVFLGGPGGTCGLWPLYQVERLGNDSTCGPEGGGNAGCAHPDPLVTVFDVEESAEDPNACDDFISSDVDLGDAVVYARLPFLAPAVNPNFFVDGSVSGTLAHVARAMQGTTVSSDEPEESCGDRGGDFSDNCGISPCEGGNYQEVHRRPSFVLRYQWATSTGALERFGFGDATIDLGTESDADPDFGASSEIGPAGGWYGDSVWTPRPPRHGWGSVVTTYTTGYADVTNQALAGAGAGASTSLPGGTQNRHTYGHDACLTMTSGPSNVNPYTNWDCSVSSWVAERTASGILNAPLLGDRYDLRDVDCYDNTVSESVDRAIKAGVMDCATDDTATHPT